MTTIYTDCLAALHAHLDAHPADWQARLVLAHVWAKGERIHWGYQAVIRNGLIDELRGPISQWLADKEGRRMRDSHPITVYRPTIGRGWSDYTAQAGLSIRLWQDQQVGRLQTLDLRVGCRDEESNGYFHVCSRHAYRPWRGLGRVLLPRVESRVLTPPTRVEFGEPLPEENET